MVETALTQADYTPTARRVADKKLSILLIDDDSGVRLLLNKGLTVEGYQLYEAEDGIVGLERFRAIQPDVILLDITMPRLDGITVLKEIRRYDPVVGIIMVSALNPQRLTVEPMAQGADGYIQKPFKLQEIRKEIQRVSKLVYCRRYNVVSTA